MCHSLAIRVVTIFPSYNRRMLAALRIMGWIVCVIYSSIPAFWLMIHPFASYWRTRPGSPYRILLPLWIAMWMVIALMTARWRQLALYSSPWAWLLFLLLFAAGLGIYSSSARDFTSAQLSGLPEVLPGHAEQRLVTTGIRARVRHPVYLAHLCEMLAWSAGTGLAVCYSLTACTVFTGWLMIRLEEKELEQRFGEEFRQYQAAVPLVLPRVR